MLYPPSLACHRENKIKLVMKITAVVEMDQYWVTKSHASINALNVQFISPLKTNYIKYLSF